MRTTLVVCTALLLFAGSAHAQEFNGSGEHATNFVELPAGLTFVDLTHDGDGDFRVRLLDARGVPVHLLADARGTADLTRAVRIRTGGAYLFDVVASGAWQIRLRSDQAAVGRIDLAELGRVDGRDAAQRAGSARWLGIGFAGGIVLGPIGAGAAYLAAGARTPGEPPALPADAAGFGAAYGEAYRDAYRTGVASERRTAALVGGLVGAAANAVLLLHFTRSAQGDDGDGLPIIPEFSRGRVFTTLLTVPLPARP